jgi:tetratricopeptide (TPR) repeat protein/predicted Ser/Thr protein kinase
MNEDQARNAFLRRYLADREAGVRRPLAEYQAESPSRANEIASWFERYEREEPAEEPLAARDRVGRYRVVREIGRGGQGVVYLARDETLRRDVAVKILTGLGALSADRVRRFLREAEVASRLQHPGIAAVYELGTDGRVPFIAMRYVEGRTLVEGAKEPLDVEESTRIVARVARTLHYAHEFGVVHRDVKPANIMLTREGDPVVLDFGLARDGEERDEIQTLTRSGETFGTPAYMSPEQIDGRGTRPDRRTDVWSLGATLYELLAGRRPFDAPTRDGLYRAILTEEPIDVRRLAPAVSRDLAAIVETALQKDMAPRYADAAAMASDLEAYLSGRPTAARRVGAFGRAARYARREPARAALVVLAMVALPSIAALTATQAANRGMVEAARRVQIAEEQDALLARGAFEFGEGDPGRALDRYREAFALAPTPEALAGIVFSLNKLGRANEAATALDTNIELVSGSRIESLARAAVLTSLKRDDEVEKIHRALPAPKSAADYYVEGDRLLEEGHAGDSAAFAEALRNFRVAILRSPGPRASYFEGAAHAAFHAGDADMGREFADAVRARWPDSATGAYWAGAAYSLSSADDAIAAYRVAIRLRPEYAEAHCNLGVELSKKGLVEDAMKAYRAAIAINPNFYEPRRNLCSALWTVGKIEESIVEIREAVRVRPNAASARHFLGAALDVTGDLGGAIEHYRAASALEPRSGRYALALGDALRRLGRIDESIVSLRQAVESNPKDAETRNVLGSALMGMGRFEEALVVFEETVALRPDHAEAYCNIGHVSMTLGRFAEGLAAFRKGHELSSGREDWKYPSAEWVARAEDAVRAEHRMLELAFGDVADVDRAELLESAALAEQTRRWVAAARLYERAFATPAPDSPDAPELAVAAARAGIEASIALASSTAAAETRPSKASGDSPEARRRFARERLTGEVARLSAEKNEGAASESRASARKAALASVLRDPLFTPYFDGSAESISSEERREWAALYEALRDATR